MPKPTSSTTVSRPDLGQLAYEYALAQSRTKFIGLRLMPVFNTVLKTAEYPVIPLEALLKQQNTKRGTGGNYNRGNWQFEMGNYSCVENGWEEVLFDDEVKLYASLFDAEEITTEICMDVILRAQEIRIKNKLFNTSNFSVHNVTNEWDDVNNATPITDVDAGKNALRLLGIEANALAVGYSVFQNMSKCAQIAAKVQYTTPIEIMSDEQKRQLLSAALGVEVLVGDAVVDSAKKGQSFSASDVWGTEYGLLCRIATNPNNLKEPCLGRTFLWTEDSPSNVTVESYREEAVRGDVIRARQHTDEAFVFSGAGYLLGNLTT